jgi:hypothetical protein
MLQPGAEEKVPTAQPKACRVRRRFAHHPLHLRGELPGRPLIGIEQKEPRMFEGKLEGGIPMRGVVVESAGVEVSAGVAGDLLRGVSGVRVEHVDVVRPRDRSERRRQVMLLILREDKDGDAGCGHWLMVSRSGERRAQR